MAETIQLQRLVLFDIDETIIASYGSGRRALSRVLHELYGVTEEHMQINMSGKTDPQILKEILLAANMDEIAIHQSMDKTIDLYLEILEEELLDSERYIVHDGVYELIDAINDNTSFFLGLLTGNVERGARLKLERSGLNKHFAIGAYGSDSANRLDLPAIARERAQRHFKVGFEPQDLVIIGDAVNDVLCAKGFGAKCIAVNTGKTSWSDLQAQNPEFLFQSLADTKTILDAIHASMPTMMKQ